MSPPRQRSRGAGAARAASLGAKSAGAAGAGAPGAGAAGRQGRSSRRRPTESGQILDGIAEVAREHLGWQGPLAPGMRLVEDLNLDSIRLLTLTVEIENRFRVILEPADERAVETVGDLVELVRSKLG